MGPVKFDRAKFYHAKLKAVPTTQKFHMVKGAQYFLHFLLCFGLVGTALIGVRAQKFQGRPLGIPSPTGKASPTVLTLIYHLFGQCPPLYQRALEGFRGS